MIPAFPEFKKLEWTDRAEVETITAPFPPYSDFNFTSMYCWNTADNMMLSKLNNNLVVLFTDYTSQHPFLSFIGNHKPNETAEALIAYSKEKFQSASLKLIPEAVAEALCHTLFHVTADEDAHDYIYDISYLLNLNTLPGKNNDGARNLKKFLKLYPHYTIKKYCNKEMLNGECRDMFILWSKNKNQNHWELNEFKAFERLHINKEADSQILCIYDGDKMIGFQMMEMLSDNYAVCHFAKGDVSYKGIYDALMWEVGKALHERGINFLNFEQDLGIASLRTSKEEIQAGFLFEEIYNRKEKLIMENTVDDLGEGFSSVDLIHQCLIDEDKARDFEAVLKSVIKPTSNVLELGTGSGILSLLSARAGAKTVTAIEFDPFIANVARQNIKQNGFENTITIKVADARSVVFPKGEKFDVVVMEMLCTGLVEEMQVQAINNLCAQNLITSETHVVPSAHENYIALAQTNYMNHGFEMRMIKYLWSHNSERTKVENNVKLFSEPQLLNHVDFTKPIDELFHAKVQCIVKEAGILNSILLTSKTLVDKKGSIALEATFSLNPPVAIPLPDREVKKGEVITISVTYKLGGGFPNFKVSYS